MKFLYAIFLSLMMGSQCYALTADNLITIVDCESSGRYNAVGDKGKSVGIVQFQKATFNWMKKAAGHPEYQWKNPIQQMRLMMWAIDNGYGNNWTCYKRLLKKVPVMDSDNPLHLPDQPVIQREEYGRLLDN